MESLIANAFGQYVNVQRGEADHITKGAKAVFRSADDGSALSMDIFTAVLCKLCTCFYFHNYATLFHSQLSLA